MSRIVVHGSLPFDDLSSILNREVPLEFSGERDNPLENPVKKDTLKWTVKRSDISVANNSGKLEISSAFTGTVNVRGTVKLVIKVPLRAHADVSGRASARLRPELQRDWHVTPHIDADVDLNKVVIRLKDIGDLSVDNMLREELGKQLAKLAGMLTTRVDSDDTLRREATKLWERLCRAESFKIDGSSQSLLLEPHRIVVSNPEIEDDRVVFGLGIEATMRIVPSEAGRPSCPASLQEPEFVPLTDTGELNLVIPMRIGWQVVSRELTRLIKGKHLGVLTAQALTLSASKARMLVRFDYAIGANMRTTFATARPVYEPIKRSLSFEQLRFTDESGNARPGFDAALDRLLPSAIGTLRFDLRPEFEKVTSVINSALHDLSVKLGQEGFNAAFEISTIDLHAVSPGSDGLDVLFAGKGKASVEITALSLN